MQKRVITESSHCPAPCKLSPVQIIRTGFVTPRQVTSSQVPRDRAPVEVKPLPWKLGQSVISAKATNGFATFNQSDNVMRLKDPATGYKSKSGEQKHGVIFGERNRNIEDW